MPPESTPNPATRIHTPPSYFEPLSIPPLFEHQQSLEVEIGCGNGSFLARYAEEQPKTNFLGIERLLGRLRKLDKKLQRRNLKNVTLLRVEAFYAVQYLIPRNSVSAYHIYFPDPWPKKKHWKNRLVADKLIPHLERSLVCDGLVYLRTDNESYFEQMLDVFQNADSFHPVDAPESLIRVTTDFEATFNAKGIPTLRAQYRYQEPNQDSA